MCKYVMATCLTNWYKLSWTFLNNGISAKQSKFHINWHSCYLSQLTLVPPHFAATVSLECRVYTESKHKSW